MSEEKIPLGINRCEASDMLVRRQEAATIAGKIAVDVDDVLSLTREEVRQKAAKKFPVAAPSFLKYQGDI